MHAALPQHVTMSCILASLIFVVVFGFVQTAIKIAAPLDCPDNKGAVCHVLQDKLDVPKLEFQFSFPVLPPGLLMPPDKRESIPDWGMSILFCKTNMLFHPEGHLKFSSLLGTWHAFLGIACKHISIQHLAKVLMTSHTACQSNAADSHHRS